VREALDQEGGRQQFGTVATIAGSFGGVILGSSIACFKPTRGSAERHSMEMD